MSRLKDACPYDSRVRAERCASCCKLNEGLTPCVVALLRATPRTRRANVLDVTVWERKAA